MNAMEKVAWFELWVSTAALVTVSCLFPWLGDGATAGFAFLGLLGVSAIFLRQRGQRLVVDERDRDIEMKAIRSGVRAAWMTNVAALIASTLWASHSHIDSISVSFLTWLIWIQCAVCYGVKGLVGILAYRRPRRAT